MNGHYNGDILGLKPSTGRSSSPPRDSWADGLRGIACVCVVTCHTSQAFFPWLLQPTCAENEAPHLFQLPFLRIITSHGRCVVALFFILTGFVNSLKPIRQIRDDDKIGALTTLARSSFNRTGRLVFPAMILTIVTWFICQLGFFNLALKSDSHWMIATGGRPSATWPKAVVDLFKGILDTWWHMNDPYDQPQWTLAPLLKGSYWVYATLFITVHTKSTFRIFVEIGFYIYSYCERDCLTGINIFAGMILAELSFIYNPSNHSFRPSTGIKNGLLACTPLATAILGLYLMSFPDRNLTWMAWSYQLDHLGHIVFPPNSDIIGFWPAIGAQIFCFSVFFSPLMRRALSHPFLLYLGTISFPLYLIHGPLMRSVLAWMAFGPGWLRWKPDPGMDSRPHDIPAVNPLALVVILPIFWTFLFTVVHYWTRKVEPLIAKATKNFQDFAQE